MLCSLRKLLQRFSRNRVSRRDRVREFHTTSAYQVSAWDQSLSALAIALHVDASNTGRNVRR